MARSLSIIWHEEVDQLEALYKSEKEPQRWTRLHALWLVRLGPTVQSVAPLVGIRENIRYMNAILSTNTFTSKPT